jgi:UDP-N-acetylglucosamine:LPS N-acetylglucosamine transferase
VKDRLKLYGVRPDKIFLTGFPLPEENVGESLENIKYDLGRRLIQLDPDKIYISQFRKTLQSKLKKDLRLKPVRPLTITFCVGGAGAQRELGLEITKSLRKDVMNNNVNINLVAGCNLEVMKYYKKEVRSLRLGAKAKRVRILYESTKPRYFRAFNRILRNTDILWTKPSELSFYCALGLPIIIAPPIGSQEVFNQKWLQSIGAGMNQEDPKYTNEWLSDWLKSGWLAEAAMKGFMEAPKFGTYNTKKIVFHDFKGARKVKTILQY